MGEIEWREYDYTIQLGPNAVMIPRPLIEVEVSCRTSSEKVRMLAMIDSGTDGTVMHGDIARSLGLDPKNCQPAKLGGIGTIDAFLSNVKIFVPDFKVSIEGPVIFADKLPFDILLGQKDFFARFNIRFERSVNKFFLAET